MANTYSITEKSGKVSVEWSSPSARDIQPQSLRLFKRILQGGPEQEVKTSDLRAACLLRAEELGGEIAAIRAAGNGEAADSSPTEGFSAFRVTPLQKNLQEVRELLPKLVKLEGDYRELAGQLSGDLPELYYNLPVLLRAQHLALFEKDREVHIEDERHLLRNALDVVGVTAVGTAGALSLAAGTALSPFTGGLSLALAALAGAHVAGRWDFLSEWSQAETRNTLRGFERVMTPNDRNLLEIYRAELELGAPFAR